MTMDASTSPDLHADINVGQFFFHIQNSSFPKNFKHSSTIIKYTKLPEFDFDSKVVWPQKNSYILQPRLRRIISIDEDDHIMRTSRSVKNEICSGSTNFMPTSYSNRKVTTIDEHKETRSRGPSPKVKHEFRVSSAKYLEKSELKSDYLSRQRLLRSASAKSKQDAKSSANNFVLSNNNLCISPSRNMKTQSESKTRQMLVNKNSIIQEREKLPRKNANTKNINKTVSGRKSTLRPSTSEKNVILLKGKIYDKTKNEGINNTLLPVSPKLKEVNSKIKSPVIYVPIDNKPIYKRDKVNKTDCFTEVEYSICTRETGMVTDPRLNKVDIFVDVKENMSQTVREEKKEFKELVQKLDIGTTTDVRNEAEKTNCSIQTEDLNVKKDRTDAPFDNLEVPNVTLLKEKSDISKENELTSQSLPHLQIPEIKIKARKEQKKPGLEHQSRSTSFIIGRATVTYTTKQEFDFHVVKDQNGINEPSSPLAYPMNVVTVLKKKISKEFEGTKKETKESKENLQQPKDISSTANLLNCLNEIKSLNCSYIFKSTKLVKPSKVISTINVNKGLLQSDFICEQFQRELNFIDSFFESLQYLESCSLSGNKVENIVSKSGLDTTNPEYDSFFSKFENGTNIDDTETMASKSLCLLNLLIHDEHRRAKNLLFVLKMREAALKDFTKSQILWLENKKKQENTDIPTLKKKQRGALLKLQHECGEMQRMRKALLALSEKRKVALMKTKKNIELKLKNNVTVDQIFLGKKKLKRSSTVDRCTVPLKCFDLSSSGCDDSSTSRGKSEHIDSEIPQDIPSKSSCAEKCIQTGDSLITSLVNQSTDTAAEHFLTVDGSYLNILFANLSLPEIFSGGKQYEVNEEALRSIVASTNSLQNSSSKSDIVEKLLEQFYNRDQDVSTSPSTARSLVEELDQYYKVLAEEEKLSADLVKEERKSTMRSSEVTFSVSREVETERGEDEARTMTDESVESATICAVSPTEFNSLNSVTTQVLKGKDAMSTGAQAGALSVPAEQSLPDTATNSTCLIPFNKSSTCSTFSTGSSTVSLCLTSSVVALSGPSHNEAEELRRQQLAIEREIKALEQQQCQLVVREIPDKPPPPYTPPADARSQRPVARFVVDNIEEKVHNNLSNSITVSIEPTNSFDVFLQDYCQESVSKRQARASDKPWDACNLLPQKPPLDNAKLVQKTAADLKEVLGGMPSTAVTGVGARRADHIDDILLSEWRRCEPAWTALHSDEAYVKSQIFEAIFQKILTETIDEYKKTLVSNEVL